MLRDYRILECIGQGGMGRVYRAMHVRLQKQVALKTLKAERLNSREALLRFTREMQLLAKLEHANIVRALDAGEHEGMHYFVMELVAGIDLSQLVKRLGPLPIREACGIMCLAAEALQYAHDRKILHRDVKPSNLMITAQGGVKLLDLGLAQVFQLHLDDQISRLGQTVGTLAYMSPEQLTQGSQCSNQSDVFSLGVSLHELLSGQRPCYQAGSLPSVADLRTIRPDVDDELSQLLDQMIAPSPGDRPQSMAEVGTRLKNFATNADLASLVSEYYRWNHRGGMLPTPPPICSDTKEISAVKTSASSLGREQSTGVQQAAQSGTKSGRRRIIAYLLSGAAVFAAAAFIYQQLPDNPPPPPPPSNLELPPDKPMGVLEILSPVDDGLNAADQVTRHIIAAGLLARPLKENEQDGEVFNVKEGQNNLPPGEYELLMHGPVDFEPEQFQVYRSATTKITPKISLKNSFQFAVMPVAGNYAAYHGRVWLANWPSKNSTTFDLRLEVLLDDEQASPRTKWLKVDVQCFLESGTYREVGYLKIDSAAWARGQLSILDGWVEASGESIKQFINDRIPDIGANTLVVKFDPETDVLKELAPFTLPQGRLSVQDMLVLYFGDNRIAAADEIITKLRAGLSESGERNVWLERKELDKGIDECYVVSSRSRDQEDTEDGWRIARTRENPFEIAELQAKTQFLEAHCYTVSSGMAITNPDELRKTLEDLATRKIDPAKLSKPHPFDQARIPDLPSSFSAGGTVTRGNQTETIEFTVSMLGIEEVDGRKLHWLEVDLTTDPAVAGHREIARLLVDAAEYPDGSLKLVQGWLAFDNGSTVLPVSTNGSLESVINARLKLAAAPHFNGIGVVDLMWMLFKVDFTPRSPIADLRGLIDRLIKNRVSTVEDVSFKKYGNLKCVRYEPSAAKAMPVTYKIYRCSQVPFGIAAVDLVVPGVSIHLKLESYTPAGQRLRPFLGSKEDVASLEKATAQQLLAREKPNWRVWTWNDPNKTYKVWAEFGGTVDSTKPVRKDVLLWDGLGKECRIAEALLSPADRDWVQLGRVWMDPKRPNGFPRRVLMGTKGNGNVLQLGHWDATANRIMPTGSIDKESLHPRDKLWLDTHRRSVSSAKSVGFEEFARYVR